MFDGEQFGQQMVTIIKGYVEAELAPVRDRIATLERELEAVRAKGLTYRGVWQRASDYDRGAIVTHGGSAWAATRAVANGEEPGKGTAWQLMLKSR